MHVSSNRSACAAHASIHERERSIDDSATQMSASHSVGDTARQGQHATPDAIAHQADDRATNSVCLLGPPLAAWQSNDAALQVEMQLARLESSVQLLRVDTSRVVQQAKAFLKQHHRVQVASSSRSHLVARASEQSFTEHAHDRFASHTVALKEAIVRQSSQPQRVNETRERLQALNLSLSAVAATKSPRSLPVTKAQVLQLRQIQRHHKQLNASIVSLVIDTAKEAVVRSIAAHDAQAQRADATRILDSLRQLEAEIDAHTQRQTSKNSGAFFFYTFVMCLTGGYLWTAASERKRRLQQRRASNRVWSPVPRFLLQIKDLLKSAVVIEDLRRRSELLVDDGDDGNKDDDLGSVMVRTFIPTPKVAQTARMPSSLRKL